MKLKELVRHLTKYYAVFISNNSLRYEDQTVISKNELDAEVETFDFYEDDGDGETLLVNLREAQVDDRQITFNELEDYSTNV